MTASCFELKDVSYSYAAGGKALQGVNLNVSRGERLALLGANGSGKSTLLKIMDGLLFADQGDVLFGEIRLTESGLEDPVVNANLRSHVGFIFQNPDIQLFSSTVEADIAFGPRQLGLPEMEVQERVSDCLNLLRISHLRLRQPQTLSGGEKKRVAIAATLAGNPDILLLDEPTLALDPRTRWELVDILIDLHKIGKTIIIATHDLEIVEAVADKAVILSPDGKVLASGPIATLLGDAPLLEQANLIHVHTHQHAGSVHRHGHIHRFPTKEHHQQ